MFRGEFIFRYIFSLGVFFVVILTSIISHSQSRNDECIPRAEIIEIAKHFTQFSRFTKNDFCNDDSKDWHLISSIVFMRQTQFDAIMPVSKDGLFSGKFAKGWYNYFINRINKFEVVSECAKGVIAYVYATAGDKTMYTCPAALTDRFSSLDRASVMMHEARHLDGFPHITCTHGARQGLRGACDTRISTGGSYGVTVETYAQLGKYAQGIHPALKAYAKLSSVVYADEAFEEQVNIDRTENLLVLTKSLDFYQVDLSNNTVTKLGQAPQEGKIIKRSQHLIIFPNDKSQIAQYVFPRNEGQIAQSPMDFVSEYNASTPSEKAEFVDIHVGAQWNAKAFKTKISLVCDPATKKSKEFQLPKGQIPENFIYPEGYSRDKYKVLLTTDAGNIYELSCLNKVASLKSSTVRFDSNFKRIYKVNSNLLGLGSDGKIYKIVKGVSSEVSLPLLEDEVIEIASEQSFTFFN